MEGALMIFFVVFLTIFTYCNGHGTPFFGMVHRLPGQTPYFRNARSLHQEDINLSFSNGGFRDQENQPNQYRSNNAVQSFSERPNGNQVNNNAGSLTNNVVNDDNHFQNQNELSLRLRIAERLPPPPLIPSNTRNGCTTWTSPEGIRFTLKSRSSSNSITTSQGGQDCAPTEFNYRRPKAFVPSPSYYSPGSASDFVYLKK